MGLFILGIFLILWGCATFLVAVIKPKALWQMGKIQGFIKLLGDGGTMILFIIMGVIAVGGGVILVIILTIN